MTDPLASVFSGAAFAPHGACLLWRSDVIWLHVVSDGLIAVAYYSIPFALVHFARRRADLSYSRLLHMFAAFILLCGTTHLMGIWTLWNPDYVEEGLIKAATAAVSVATAIAVWPLVPKLLALPSPAQLAVANEGLRQQIDERREAEAAVHGLNQQLEARVEERTRELRRSNDRLQQFAYAASHDLREPLRTITGYLQLIERRYRDRLDADGAEFIELAVDGSRRMKELIDDLLAYSRLGSAGFGIEPVVSGEVVDAVLSDLEATIEETGADVRVADLPVVRADAALLRQVFQNLVSNAIRYRGERPARVRISAEQGEGVWVFSVADRGIGVPPESRERVFGVFERLHACDEISGTGMGLSICRAAVEAHGGSIWVEPNPEGGSVFRFTLPVQPAESR